MASSAPTILDLKSSFLRSQILALSTPIRPSSAFTASNNNTQDNALRQRAIDEVLQKLNGLLKSHNKLVYAPQAQRHVAEQIDRLYWARGERGVDGDVEEWKERGADFKKESLIEILPEDFSVDAEEKAPEQAAQYKTLQQRLVQLNEERRAKREKLEGYKQMKGLVDLFDGEGEVQRNLVIKDGEMENELENMRRLMLRVQRGLGTMERAEDMDVDAGDDVEVDVDEQEEGKLLMALLSGSAAG